MLGVVQKLLYILTLGPFEKTVQTAGLNFDFLDKQAVESFGQSGDLLPKTLHGKMYPLGMNWEEIRGTRPEFQNEGTVKIKRQVSSPFKDEIDGKGPTNTSTTSIHAKTSPEKSETPNKGADDEGIRKVNLDALLVLDFVYILYSGSIFLVQVGKEPEPGTETFVLYMKRVAAMMVMTVAIIVVKNAFIECDYLTDQLAGIFVIVLWLVATTQVILSIPEFYREIYSFDAWTIFFTVQSHLLLTFTVFYILAVIFDL